jgi:hypothetical protein
MNLEVLFQLTALFFVVAVGPLVVIALATNAESGL